MESYFTDESMLRIVHRERAIARSRCTIRSIDSSVK